MSPDVISRLLIVCSLAGVCGCSQNSTNAELAQVYRVGMTRGEAANLLGEPMRVETRPAEGWDPGDKGAARASALAAQFEQGHPAVVQTCEVYWVPRGFMGLGAWWDYLFFGPDDRLLGFRRRLVD